MWDNSALVSFSAQNCTIPLCIKERVYMKFILSSRNMLSCIMTMIRTAQMNCLALSLLPLKLSSSEALVLLNKWSLVNMLVRIACTMENAAMAAASVLSL